MKQISFLFFYMLMYSTIVYAQKNIVTSGGLASGTGGVVTYSIGQLDYQVLSGTGGTVHQGVQHPTRLQLNVKAFIEGYYTSSNSMNTVLYNQGILPTQGNECDSITVELHQSTTPYPLLETRKVMLNTNGTIVLHNFGNIGQSYYVVLKHRNAIETWSAQPITMSENTTYDFASTGTAAYGANQIEVENGVWALYSGDLNKDDNIDLLDISFAEADINQFLSGYYASDINGDGNVDLLDVSPVENNANAFVFAVKP